MPQDPTTGRQVTIEEWEDIVFEKYGVPKNLRKAMADRESGGKGWDAESPTGVRGKYQVTKGTAAMYGLNRDDPYEQVVAAARYLRDNYDYLKKDIKNDNSRWLG